MPIAAHIPIVAVSYNSPDLIEILLRSVRQFYTNKVYIIDGSAPDIVGAIEAVTRCHANVEFIPFHYNIHHGPGMAWAIRNLGLCGPVLFLDSDVELLHPGLIEDLAARLEPQLYGVGWITEPTLLGGSVQPKQFPYLSPLCMLCNMDVMRQWPMPIKHGAPMITPMLALAQAGRVDLLRHVDWIENDCTHDSVKKYMRHDWQGTVRRTSGYHYDAVPQVEEPHSPEVLALIPTNARTVVEIGCRGGSLARAYKKLNPACDWTGLEPNAALVDVARKPCDFVFHLDANSADDSFFRHAADSDCWVISTPMEQIDDPWALLTRIRSLMPAHASLVTSFANMQHWSVQARLNQGLVDHDLNASHRRPRWWFTRSTMLSLGQNAGLQVAEGSAKMDPDDGARFMPAIRHMAELTGSSPEIAVQDSSALRYTFRFSLVAESTSN
jgi:hypothetical protein